MLTPLHFCSVCGSTELEEIISLPCLPLTGLYYPDLEKATASPTFNQGLSLCHHCGHSQLTNYIDPSIVYDESYTHRTSTSPLSTNGNDFLFNYIINNVSKEDLLLVLEAGCNDCYLLNRLQDFSIESSLYGFDPIWIDRDPCFQGLHVFGSFVEDINTTLPDIKPSLVISAHTFEHVVHLRESLSKLVEFAAPNARFIIEMPSFDTLLRLKRFDQIFHQHVQYISESSIYELIKQLKCSLNNILYNYNYWGGTVIFDFSKIATSDIFRPTLKPTKNTILKSFSAFERNFEVVSSSIPEHSDVSILGAAQMLPILIYHSKNWFDFKRILDDNPSRIGSFLPNTALPIESFSDYSTASSCNSSFVIGAVDSTRALVSRSKQIGLPNVFSLFNSLI